MKKIVNIVLIIVIIISVGFNFYLLMEIKGINESIVSIRNEKTELEATVTEKETALEEKDSKIIELEQTILDLTAEIEALKEQISSIESEKAEINEELETVKKEIEEVEQKGSEQSSTTGGTGHTESTEGGGQANVTPPDGCTTAEDFSAMWGVTVGTGTTNPNSTGGSNGAINWG